MIGALRSAVAPWVDAAVAVRELLASSGGWIRARGVLLVHAGVLVDQPAVARVIHTVHQALSSTQGESGALALDPDTIDALVEGTVVVLRPGASFVYEGANYAYHVVEYPGPLLARGVVTVALGDDRWPTNLALGLTRLWYRRAGLERRGEAAWGLQ